MVAEENKKANENAPTPQSLDKDAMVKGNIIDLLFLNCISMQVRMEISDLSM